MKKSLCIIILFFYIISLYAVGIFGNSHDITSLRKWGPYSKRYVGISHIPNLGQGLRFDFSVMPGIYRNRLLVPHVLYESSYYPWKVTSDFDRITYRYELEWKDRVYVDVEYFNIDTSNVLVSIRCVNNTNVNQCFSLNNIAYIDKPDNYPSFVADKLSDVRWIDASNYLENESSTKDNKYNLVYDGKFRDQILTSESLDGSVIRKNFRGQASDKLVYSVRVDNLIGVVALRLKVDKGNCLTFKFTGLANDTLKVIGTGNYEKIIIPYECNSTGEHNLSISSVRGNGTISFDGFWLGDKSTVNAINVIKKEFSFTPDIVKKKNSLILKYNDSEVFYGIAWNESNSVVREIFNSELESFFRKKVHDHTNSKLYGDKKWHYSNVFIRPVVVKPQSEKVLYTLLSAGTKENVEKAIASFKDNLSEWEKVLKEDDYDNNNYLPGYEKYKFSYDLLKATLFSNIVYPVYTQGEYIRHFTPGKNWNSLYTWDSGFISLGLSEVNDTLAFENIKAYTTEEGAESAFIHHGSPLPTQFFAYSDLWNSSGSKEFLSFLYPRLKQYFDFMVGEVPTSSTLKSSGILSTWDYFYNSGGWDDYPPQIARWSEKDAGNITPVVTSSYYIRAAKIMRMAAGILGFKSDIKYYDRIIQRTSEALQKYSWDEKSGYFSYVRHDSEGNPIGFYLTKSGENYNKGFDGITPFVAGICTESQYNTILNNLFSDKFWTNVGLSTVDRTASYYREDGYWNGAVWFPHQWILWKSLLDNGEIDRAYQLARKAMDIWSDECNRSYFTYEHFIISSERGAGWHQFSGLSSPLLNWFSSYYKIGKVTTGFEVWLENSKFTDDYTSYSANLVFDKTTKAHKRSVIVCMNPERKYKVLFNNRQIDFKERYPGLIEILIPSINKKSSITIKSYN